MSHPSCPSSVPAQNGSCSLDACEYCWYTSSTDVTEASCVNETWLVKFSTAELYKGPPADAAGCIPAPDAGQPESEPALASGSYTSCQTQLPTQGGSCDVTDCNHCEYIGPGTALAVVECVGNVWSISRTDVGIYNPPYPDPACFNTLDAGNQDADVANVAVADSGAD